MIDLHLHLDGSLSLDDFKYLAKKNNVPLGKNFPQNVYVPNGCTSLEEYLTRFDLPCSLLQDEESLEYATCSLVNRLYDEDYIYAEIRFAPQLHTLKGLNEEQVIRAAVRGLKKGLEGKKGFDANLILCCMRQSPYEVNIKTVEAGAKVNDPKVVAFDLAGPEAFKPSLYYRDVFEAAQKTGMHITIHAGEACGNDSIMGAIEIGATRIGHGVHLSLDEQTLKVVHEKNIYFEFCPTSNLQTTSLSCYQEVPLRKFKANGIKTTINSDNMTVSHTDVLDEFRHLYKTFKLSKAEVKELLTNSIEASFTSEEQKNNMKVALNDKINSYYDKISL